MTSQQERKLCFVSWNTRGIKNTKDLPQKSTQWLNALNTLEADIVFIQETHVGPGDYDKLETVEGWKVYFTVYNPRSKGVAILIRDHIGLNGTKLPFKAICHDEDISGSYIVLFCHLYGELYTLVNVYNHKEDRLLLYRLKEYLQETAEGVLVVGGDFNTVLDLDLDRRSKWARQTEPSSLRGILKEFTESLNLRDTWAHLHTCTREFTRSERNSASRLDMFFIQEHAMRRVSTCEINKSGNRVEQKKISDHDLVVLTLRVQDDTVNKIPNVALWLVESENDGEPDRRSGKINGAQILSAIKSMTNSGEKRLDGLTVDYYKEKRCQLTETLKIKYNNMLKNKQIPPMFDNCYCLESQYIFNTDYLIFALTLAKHLRFLTPPFNQVEKAGFTICFMVPFAEAPKKIKWCFLETCLMKLKDTHPGPQLDFSILNSILPKDTDCEEFRCLRQGCPLTMPILTLALQQLDKQLIEIGCVTSFCQFRQTLLINTDIDRYKQALSFLEQFLQDNFMLGLDPTEQQHCDQLVQRSLDDSDLHRHHLMTELKP